MQKPFYQQKEQRDQVYFFFFIESPLNIFYIKIFHKNKFYINKL